MVRIKVSIRKLFVLVAFIIFQGFVWADDSLLTHITFDGDDFTTGQFIDHSGKSNHIDCQPAYPLNNTFYNQCPKPVAGPDGSTAAEFYGKDCVQDADYIAVTDNPMFKNMAQGTIALWAYYAPEAYGSAHLIDSWDYVPGAWGLGRYYNWRATHFFVAPENVLLHGDYLLYFPDEYVYDWNHYVVTWDGSNVRGYFNGELFDTVDQHPASFTTNKYYLGLGVFTHYFERNSLSPACTADPYNKPAGQNYLHPNCGFLIGKLDDVRIYNRALSQSEISSLASVYTPHEKYYLLKVTKSGDSSGTVTSTPSGINCGSTCYDNAAGGTTVTLTAIPSSYAFFSGWTGACEGKGTCTLAMNSHKSVTANFDPLWPAAAYFEAESGSIESPFSVSDGAIYQRASSSLSNGGRAVYTFTIVEQGDYIVVGRVNALMNNSNSFYVNIDAEPTEVMAWHIRPYTVGFDERIVSWQGTGTDVAPQIDPKAFMLDPGYHTLIIRGREGATQLDSLSIYKLGESQHEAPSIIVQPVDQRVTIGSNATFSIVASGYPLNYQWFKNSIAINQAVFSSYQTPTVTETDNGAMFYCAISNDLGAVTSSTATLAVQIAAQTYNLSIQVVGLGNGSVLTSPKGISCGTGCYSFISGSQVTLMAVVLLTPHLFFRMDWGLFR